VEKILDKMVFARGKSKCAKYLIRWSEYGEKDDTWKNINNLDCDELIQEKASKPDYAAPKAYRIITLLNCLGKLSERIVAKRLGFWAETTNLGT
jgi:hypothetical protein